MRTRRRRGGGGRRLARQHHHARSDLDAGVEVGDVVVGEPDAARRHEGADGRGLVGPVDAVQRLTEVKRARAERVAVAACHEARQIRLAVDHLFRRMPVRPLRHSRHFFRAGPGEALAADADAVAQRLALAEHEIEVGVRRVDDERAGRLLGVVVDQGATELRRQRLLRPGLGAHLGRQRRVARIALHRSGGTRIGLAGAELAGIDRQRRARCILFVRARLRRNAGSSVIRTCTGSRGLVTRRSLQRRVAVRGVGLVRRARRRCSGFGIGRTAAAIAWSILRLVGLRPHGRWRQRTALLIVDRLTVLDIRDRRQRTVTLRRRRIGLRRRIRLRRWISLRRRVILRRSVVAGCPQTDQQRRDGTSRAENHSPSPDANDDPASDSLMNKAHSRPWVEKITNLLISPVDGTYRNSRA